MSDLKDIAKIINSKESFVISSHKSPDGDSIGSSIALGLILKKLNKKVTYVMESSQDKFEFLNEIKYFRETQPSSTKYDVGLFLDSSNADHLHMNSLFSFCQLTVNIDHHITNENYGKINYIDSTASATGEIIFELAKALEVKIDKDISLALYTAIVTDTGNFKYSNVTSKTHLIVSQLYEYPNDYPLINKKIFDEHSLDAVKLLGKALNNLFISNSISVISITLKDLDFISKSTDFEGIINYARDIKGVSVAIFLKELEENIYKVSFRSNTDYDVSKLAFRYGGGGHSKAAGCTISGKCMKNVIDELITTIEEDL